MVNLSSTLNINQYIESLKEKLFYFSELTFKYITHMKSHNYENNSFHVT